ncbi:MAG: DUF1569 domain-containing protein [Acidobacteriota bacterium]
MKLDDPRTVEGLIDRLRALHPDSERRWGTLTAGEMLCHVADGLRFMVEGEGGLKVEPPAKGRPVLKWVALYVLPRSGKNYPTHPKADPKKEGTKPTDFESDRERAIQDLRVFAAAPAEALKAYHPLFGAMSRRDWHQSTYKHLDHHLRQFGV